MKYLLLLLAVLPIIANARMEKSAYEKYSATENIMTTASKITWRTSDNIQKTCDEINVNITGKPYAFKVTACSIWSRNIIGQHVCTIITSKTTNNDIIGHEIKHCFFGSFH